VFSHTVRTQILSLLAHSHAIGVQTAHVIANGVAAARDPRLRICPRARAPPPPTWFRSGFVAGLNDVFLIGGILVFVSAALTLVLIRGRDFEVGAAHRRQAEPGAAFADHPRDNPAEPAVTR